MAKEEVKQAVAEETEVATAEAEVAEATEETTEETTTTDETTNADEDELSPWYYFFSQGCGWCKKSTPVVEQLQDEGYDILMLDMAEPDNQALNRELQQEYNIQCGTPWFINAETGKGICGFREKDIVELWLKGEEIPAPPRMKGRPPQIPFHGSTDEENAKFTKEYDEWLKLNEHMSEDWKSKQRTAQQVIDSPRPKSAAPPAPNIQDPKTTVKQIEKWGEEIREWQQDNNHITGLTTPERMVEMLKGRFLQNQGKGPGPSSNPNDLLRRVSDLQQQVSQFNSRIIKQELMVKEILDYVKSKKNQVDENVKEQLENSLEEHGIQEPKV